MTDTNKGRPTNPGEMKVDSTRNATFSGLVDLLTSGPVGKTVQAIVGSDITGFLARLAGAIFVAGNVYARPSWIGVALIIIGVVSVWWTRKNQQWRGSRRVLSLCLIVIGVLFILFQRWVLRKQLEYVSSYSIKSLNSFPVGSKLDAKTRSKTTHGGIVRVTIRETDLFNKAGPELVSITDESGLVPEGDPRVINTLNQEASTLAHVIPDRKSLTFLIAPAGMGKETILRQWVYALGVLGHNKRHFKHIFLLTIRDTKPFLEEAKKASKTSGLQDALAFSYSGIVDSSEYFDLLLKNEPCLIVISEWDSLERQQRLEFLKKIADLVASDDYMASVLIGTRPEALLRDFSIDDANTFAYERYLRFLRVEPWSKDEREDYFRRQELPILPKENYQRAKQLIESKGGDIGLVGELAQNLEFLNFLVEEIAEIERVDCFTLSRRMTNRALRRSRALAADATYPAALSAFHRLAYDASQSDTRDLEFRGRISELDENYLTNSGLVDIENGSFIFSSPAVQSYFAVEGIRDYIQPANPSTTKWPVYSKTLIRDAAKFLASECMEDSEPSKELAGVKMALACSMSQHPSDYDTAAKKLLSGTLRNVSPAKLCNKSP